MRRSLLVHAPLLLAVLAAGLPLLLLVSAAFTPNELVLAEPLRLLPMPPTLANFADAARRYPIWTWLGNSVFTAGAIALGKLALSLPAGYAFAKLRFRGREAMFWIILATMTFPAVVAILPTYITVVKLGLFDTYAAMIIPSIPYVGFYVFYARQAFRKLPDAMLEAARIDGAGTFRQFALIALPNVLPSVAALGVIAFLGAWNIYLWAQLVLEDTGRKTIVTGIAMFADIEGGQRLWGPLMATGLLSALPVLTLFLAAQHWIAEAFAPGSAEQ